MSVSKQKVIKFTAPAAHYTPLGINAQRVVAKRYSLKDIKGNPLEQWDDIVKRVVSHVAKAETDQIHREEFMVNLMRLMETRAFIPNTPCLVNAGKPKPQLAACFVIPVPDSLDGIMDHAKHCALIHQSGGGCVPGGARSWATFFGFRTVGGFFQPPTRGGCGGGCDVEGRGYGVNAIK